MNQLINELSRLYLMDAQRCFEEHGADDVQPQPLPVTPARLEQHLLGLKTLSLELVSPAGLGRAIVLDFSAGGAARGEQQWRALCLIANAVRDELGLPAPAVSISGHGFQLWLSLAAPAPAADIAEFAALLRGACLAEQKDKGNGVPATVVELPPARQASGKWAAFIHPGMGASFADEPALEMAPPLGAQIGFLEGLKSIDLARFAETLAVLRAGAAPPVPVPVPVQDSVSPPADGPQEGLHGGPHEGPHDGLLLKDATLEDIVRHLHARRIEPTFRHLLP